MRTVPASIALLAFGSLTLVACGGKDAGATGGATTTSTAKSTTTSAPSGTSSTVAAKGARKGAKNTPKEKPATAKKTEIVKRDASEVEKPITKGAGKLDDGLLKGLAAPAEGGGDRGPKKAADAPEDACKGITDNQAKCAGAKLLFCKGEEEYEIDCDEDARMSGWVGGWCQESNDEVNCVNYAYDPNAPPPEDEINCAYDDEGMPYYCCTSITNMCWTP